MSEMVERVARAMCVANGWDPDKDDEVLAPEGALNWNLYEKHARAAVEAMREPTADLVDSDSYANGLWSRRSITAYLDEALR